jgi:hypothetical protein
MGLFFFFISPHYKDMKVNEKNFLGINTSQIDYTKYYNLGHLKIGEIANGVLVISLYQVKDGKAVLKWETSGVPSEIAIGFKKKLEVEPMKDKNGIYFSITNNFKAYLKDFFPADDEITFNQINEYLNKFI